MIDRLGRRVTVAIGVVVLTATGVRLAAWLFAPIWPAILLLGTTTFIIAIALRKR